MVIEALAVLASTFTRAVVFPLASTRIDQGPPVAASGATRSSIRLLALGGSMNDTLNGLHTVL